MASNDTRLFIHDNQLETEHIIFYIFIFNLGRFAMTLLEVLLTSSEKKTKTKKQMKRLWWILI